MTSPFSRRTPQDAGRQSSPVAAEDAAIAARIRAGDERAFDQLIEIYAQELTAFAWRYVHASDPAQDAMQDVFVHLWEHRNTFVLAGSLRAYLYAAVRNRAINAVRHARVEERYRKAGERGLVASRTPPASAAAFAEGSELAGAVERAFGALSPKGRAVARLWFVNEMSHQEIADALGMTLAAVSNQVSRVGRRLRALLSDAWP
jgi:RNA polymerase sigma-70 factor, ECF subfamily